VKALPVPLLFGLFLGFTGSCTELRPVTADPEDYALYRELRLEQSFLGRLGAAWRYLESQPDGAFRPEVERWFQRADERYLTRHWDDASNLDRYVDALAGAPRVGLARARLAYLVALREAKATKEQAFLESEAQRQRDLDEAKLARGAFVRLVMELVQVQATSTDWDKPTNAWAGLKGPFFEQEPRATCSATECRKAVLTSFEIPRHEGLETRAVVLNLRAQLRQGRLRAVEIGATGLFDRLAEAATARPTDPGDLQARAEAIGVATQLLEMSLSAGFSDPACQREAVSPVVVLRQCGGRSAHVVAAENEGDEDRIVVKLLD
jgi:hypothetical protein